jgi:flagellar biosynthesis protein FlhB
MSTAKTEEPTPQKLRQLRDKGDVPLSRTMMNGGALLGAVAGLGASASASGAALSEYARWCFSLEPDAAQAIVVAVRVVAALVGPALLGGAVGGALAGVVQTGALFAPTRVLPDGERLQPGRVWQSQFSSEALVSAAITGLAAVIGSVAVWGFIRRWTVQAPALLDQEGVVGSAVVAASLDAVYGAALALLGLATIHAVVDFAWQRQAFLRRNRMSQQEIRDEYKQSEGDPQHKSRRERAHRELLAGGIRDGVARSDVILRNPTHVAVGLRYRPEEGDFPTVTIGGRGHAARQILREARRKGIPEFHDRATARATVELEPGDPVPEELFEPVAIVFRWLREQK